MLLMVGCKLTPLEIDPCGVYPDDLSECHAIPINQPDKKEYDRKIQPGDICVTYPEYGKLQKSYRDILDKCGDRCE